MPTQAPVVTDWKESEPEIFLLSSMVEHAAVNRGVVGSSPTGGAKKAATWRGGFLFRIPDGPLAQLVRAAGS